MFCCINALFGKRGIRYRSPNRVVDEIDFLVNTYGVRNLKIADELFVLHEKHYMAIVELLLERQYDLNIWAYARVDTVKPENLDKIFEPFFSTKSDGKGLGLGLDIVQQIIISCGGEIRVESRLGKGTTFYITLPVCNALKS